MALHVRLPWQVVVTRSPLLSCSSRGYISRAHPKPRPSIPIESALSSILASIEERHQCRQERWDAEKDSRLEIRKKYLSERGRASLASHQVSEKWAEEGQSYRRFDEGIELALQMNLDPRKPGQSLRGSIALPHGNGKSVRVLVFTEDEEAARALVEQGAAYAGGASLVERLQKGEVAVNSFQRTLASPGMVPKLAAVARLLGPRGLMPSPKTGTVRAATELLDALGEQQRGMAQYRTDKQGVIHVGVGRGSMGLDKLMDNVREVMKEIQSVKPEHFGKGKTRKGGKGTKYYLKAHLSATQHKGSVLLDLRTIDPTNSFFMTDANP